MTETASPRRRAPGMSPEQRRDMIVRAALPLVAEFGMAVTTQQVARAAGIGEATIFRVFADKDALIDACVVEALDSTHVLSELRSIPLDQPLAVRLVEAVDAMRGFLNRMGTVIGALHATGRPLHRPTDPSRTPVPSTPAGASASTERPTGPPVPGPTAHTAPTMPAFPPGPDRATTPAVRPSPAAPPVTDVHGRQSARDGRAAVFAETRTAIVDLLEPDAASLRLPPEKLADLFMGLAFSMRRMQSAESEELDPEELVDLFLNGVLTD